MMASSERTVMTPTSLHDDRFLRILWDETTRIISIDWKASTVGMTDEEFKGELTRFAHHVDEQKAPRILVDVANFRHQLSAETQQWRVRHISTRYNAAGVQRFAFVFSKDTPIPPMATRSAGTVRDASVQ